MKRIERQGWYLFLVIRDSLRCCYCRAALRLPGMPRRDRVRLANLEHWCPKSLGGMVSEDNLFLACALCNWLKNTRSVLKPEPREWLGERPIARAGFRAEPGFTCSAK